MKFLPDYHHTQIHKVLVFLAAANLLLATLTLPHTATAQDIEVPGYELVWSDDFDGNSIDLSKWIVIDTNQPTNFSRQDYIPQQVTVDDGKLVITSENIPSRGLPYRSGQVFSIDAQRFGRWEVRAKLPTSRGMWPAIWLLPDTVQHPWPSQGEIDIMENRGDEPFTTSSAFHWGTNPPYFHDFVYQEQKTFQAGPVNYHEGFHLYAVEWDPDQIRFMVDGVVHYVIGPSDINGFFTTQSAPMQLIINTAIGGTFLDNPDGTTVWPQTFEIDYVRVWKKTANELRLTIENSDFESPSRVLSNWTRFGNQSSNVHVSQQFANDGTSSLKLYGQFSGSANFSGIEQGKTVKPGTQVTARCDRFVPANDSINNTNNRCQLKIDFYRKRNGIFGTSDYLSSVTKTIADGTVANNIWETHQLSATVPAEAIEARVAVVFSQPNNEPGAVYIDNLDLVRNRTENKIRVGTYNLQKSPSTADERVDLQIIADEISHHDGSAPITPIDVLAFQNGPDDDSEYERIANTLSRLFGGQYAALVTDSAAGARRAGIIYNQSMFTLLDHSTLGDQGFTYPPLLATLKPIDGELEDCFSIISAQLRGGGGANNTSTRAAEAQALSNVVAGLPLGRPTIVLGDLSVRSSAEDAWTELTSSRLLDTLNFPYRLRPANWQNNLAYLPFHSNDSTGISGGMTNRFDAILVSPEFNDGRGIELLPETLAVIGNNGTHLLGSGILSGTGADGYQISLLGMSDHLPVFVDFRFQEEPSLPPRTIKRPAKKHHSVRPDGPITGVEADQQVLIRGSNSLTEASFAVIDFDFRDGLPLRTHAAEVQSCMVEFLQNNESFSGNGPIQIFLASESANLVTIDSTIQYQGTQDGIDCVPPSLSNGANAVATFPAVHREFDGSLVADGQVDQIALMSPELVRVAQRTLNTRGMLRFLAVPLHADTNATYAGRDNNLWSGPSFSARYVLGSNRPESSNGTSLNGVGSRNSPRKR